MDDRERDELQGDADDRLLRAVGEAVRAEEQVPQSVVDAALAAFTWRTFEDELTDLLEQAALSFDSGESEHGLAGVRGVATERSLTFAYADVVIDLEVSTTGTEDRALLGQVVPPDLVSVEVHRPTGPPTTAPADELGRFRLERVASGPIRLLCRFATAALPMLLTEWIVI
jgi:hypothetical protein